MAGFTKEPLESLTPWKSWGLIPKWYWDFSTTGANKKATILALRFSLLLPKPQCPTFWTFLGRCDGRFQLATDSLSLSPAGSGFYFPSLWVWAGSGSPESPDYPRRAPSSSRPGLSEHGGFRFLPLGTLVLGTLPLRTQLPCWDGAKPHPEALSRYPVAARGKAM